MRPIRWFLGPAIVAAVTLPILGWSLWDPKMPNAHSSPRTDKTLSPIGGNTSASIQWNGSDLSSKNNPGPHENESPSSPFLSHPDATGDPSMPKMASSAKSDNLAPGPDIDELSNQHALNTNVTHFQAGQAHGAEIATESVLVWEALHSKDAVARVEAILALHSQDASELATLAVTLTRDPDPDIRYHALWTLWRLAARGAIERETAFAIFGQALRDESTTIAELSTSALAELESDSKRNGLVVQEAQPIDAGSSAEPGAIYIDGEHN